MSNDACETNFSKGIFVVGNSRTVVAARATTITVNTGNTSSLSSSFLCDEPVTAYQVLAAFGASVRPADVTDSTHAENIVGLALTDCLAGEAVEVVSVGRVNFAGWSWSDTLPVYLGLTPGSLAQDDPEISEGATFSIRLGIVRDNTSIDLNIQQPILY